MKARQAKKILKHLAVMEVQPGDTVILFVPHIIPGAARKHLGDSLAAVFREQTVIVLDGGVTLGTVRQENRAEGPSAPRTPRRLPERPARLYARSRSLQTMWLKLAQGGAMAENTVTVRLSWRWRLRGLLALALLRLGMVRLAGWVVGPNPVPPERLVKWNAEVKP